MGIRVLVASATVVVAMMISGCTDDGGAGTDPSAKDNMNPTEQLLARPTAEQAAETYKAQLIRVRSALKGLAPNVEWDDQEPAMAGQSGCQAPFDIKGTASEGYVTGGGGAIPDDDWNQAIETTTKILKDEGYDEVKVLANKPGQHSVSYRGPYDTVFSISGQRSTTIEIYGGCFLTADAHHAASKDQ